MSLSTILLSLLAAFLGATLNNLYIRLHARRQNRIQNTMRLFDEFHSKEMLESRNKAYDILIDNLGSTHPLTLEELERAVGAEQYYHLQRVLYFLEKVHVMKSYDQLEWPLMWSLSGHTLSHWRDKCLWPQLSIDKSAGVSTHWLELAYRACNRLGI